MKKGVQTGFGNRSFEAHIPDGYQRVYNGLVKDGDKLYDVFTHKFNSAHITEIYCHARVFTLVIRKEEYFKCNKLKKE